MCKPVTLYRSCSILVALLIFFCVAGFLPQKAYSYDRSFGSPSTVSITVPNGDHATRVTGFPGALWSPAYEIRWWVHNGSNWKRVYTSNVRAVYTYGKLDFNWNGSRFFFPDDSYSVNRTSVVVDADVYDSDNAFVESHRWNITGQVLKYTVTFDRRGGSGGSSSVEATFGSQMPSANAPSRTGYDFLGYWDQISGGTRYYNANMSSARTWNKSQNDTLYARWEARKYTVTLDREGGSGGSSSVTATYDSAMPSSANAPNRTGYDFLGYWDSISGGTRYYNANMSSARTWNKSQNDTLYARWEARKYTVTLDREGVSGGSSSVTATYDSAMPSANAPSRIGYNFGGYFDQKNGQGTRYYNANMSSGRSWNKTSNSELYAYWIPIPYTVTLNREGGSGESNSITATYGSQMPSPTAPSRSGYTFQGYFDETYGRGTRYINSNMSSARTWDKTSSATLYANWVPDYGNKTAQEYGDAVYRYYIPLGITYNYNHAGLYSGMDSSGKHRVIEASGKGRTHDATQENSFENSFTDHPDGLAYYGAYTLNNVTLSASERRDIVAVAKQLVTANIQYPSTWDSWLPHAIEYTAIPITVGRITRIRCDGVVEYAYEGRSQSSSLTGFRVWKNANYNTWSIVTDPVSHNDRPDNTRNPERELSPWAQRGAPPSTGPWVVGFGYYSGIDWPDTRMTQPSVATGPQMSASTTPQPGGVRVTLQGTDVSGVFRIRLQNLTSQNPDKTPRSDTWSIDRTFTQAGTYPFEAWDYAGNRTAGNIILESRTLNVNSTPISSVSISSSSGQAGTTSYSRTTVHRAQVNLQAPASDPAGYTFVHWRLDGVNQRASQKSITFTMDNNRTAEAVYEPRTYDVNYHANGATSGTVPVPQTKFHGQNLTLRANTGNLARTGYTLSGWNTNAAGTGTDYPAGGIYTDNAPVGLYAKWTPNQVTITVSAEPPHGGSVSGGGIFEVGSSRQISASANQGWTFTGWNDGNPQKSRTIEAPTGGATFTANFTINQYMVTFKDYDGEELKTETVDHGSGATAPDDPIREGYTFTVWDVAFDTITDHLKVTAQYAINQYTITFDSAGGSAVDSIIEDYGTEVTPPADPTKEGYTFAGWNPDVPATMPAGYMTLTAQWTINDYTLTYAAGDNGSITGETTQTVEHGSDGTLVEAIPDRGRRFIEWSDGTTDNPRIDTSVTDNLSVIAIFDYLLGDINLDGRVDIIDAILLLRYTAGMTELTDLQKRLGNLTGHEDDADVGLGDAMMLLRVPTGGTLDLP